MSYPKRECPICGKLITNNNYIRHVLVCQGVKQDKIILSNLEIINGKYKCPICGKLYCKQGIYTHIWRCHGEGINHDPNVNNRGINRKPNARKGWTKETHPEIVEQIKKGQATMIKKKEAGWKYTPHFTKEHLEALSIRMAQHNTGGKCKWYTVNGIKVQGTYEKAFAESLCYKNIPWVRAQQTFKYTETHTGKQRRYCPDFYLPTIDLYIEIKGYWWGSDKEKMKYVFRDNPQLRGRLRILYQKKQIDRFLDTL